MTRDEALLWAATAAENLAPLSDHPARFKSARIAEALARRLVTTPKTDPARGPLLDARLSHVTPVVTGVFFKTRAWRCRTLESEDFVQATYERIIRNLDRYFDPRRGNFISFVIMTARQCASGAEAKRTAIDRRESQLKVSEPTTEPAPFTQVLGRSFLAPSQQLLGWLREFVTWTGRAGTALQETTRLAHFWWWWASRHSEAPTAMELAYGLEIPVQRVYRTMRLAFDLFGDYVRTYKSEQVASMDCWAASAY